MRNPAPRRHTVSFGVLLGAALLVACVAPAVEPIAPDEIEEPDAPVGSQTWLPDGYWPEDPDRILFLGDSITAAGGALDYRPLLLDNADDAWPEYVDRDLAWLYPDLAEVVDVSRGGATSTTLVDYQLPDLAAILDGKVEGETVTVLTVGGNDMQLALASFLAEQYGLADERVEKLLDNVEALLDFLLDEARFADGNWLYLANVYDPTDGQGATEDCFGGLDLSEVLPLLDEANTGIRDLAQERGVAMVDLRYHFAGHGFSHDDPESAAHDPDDPSLWFRDDCIHPNERGHHEIRRLFYAAIEGEPLD